MTSLWADLPVSVEYKGREYKLSPAFDNVLRMFVEVEDDHLTEWNKLDIMLYYLLQDEGYPVEPELLEAISGVLFPPGRHSSGPKVLDFEQDADLIYAAFRQVYGIDLQSERGKMHWLTFQALLSGLPTGTRLGEIIQIRSQPVPVATRHNAEEIARLTRLKAEYGLNSENVSFRAGLARMAEWMMEQVKR